MIEKINEKQLKYEEPENIENYQLLDTEIFKNVYILF